MTALVQHEIGPFTIDDWHALPARADGSRLELLEGYWLVTPPPSGPHQWAENEIILLFKNALREASRSELYAVGGVGVEIGSEQRTALIPDFVVLDTAPVGTSFGPEHVLLAGEIWSPGNSPREQRDKLDAYARAGVPSFWSVAQDNRGPTELVTYRLDRGHYVPATSVRAGEGAVRVAEAPEPVEVDIAALRL
ncbi:Uma2 family endonuclease [Actinopolyspora saharensis]|uniref:Endonuclease, Uma2 family (Restriction endonuclease fold) n=2 Tax=Actinopolyspora saharensis TaxID=995062 RepID=A0A1H0XZC0_9ACTN|nr:Uma2 family endonuclease [Actinopolyspora saharensis]SDQ08238.1 Endonuclease, Uma2 family (restriction endonuclease fold) [Actinopolyspora saharensis]